MFQLHLCVFLPFSVLSVERLSTFLWHWHHLVSSLMKTHCTLGFSFSLIYKCLAPKTIIPDSSGLCGPVLRKINVFNLTEHAALPQPEHAETEHNCPRGPHREAASIFQYRRKDKFGMNLQSVQGRMYYFKALHVCPGGRTIAFLKAYHFCFTAPSEMLDTSQYNFKNKFWLEVFTIHFPNTGAADVKFSLKWHMTVTLAFCFSALIWCWVCTKVGWPLLQMLTLLCSLNPWLNFHRSQ